MIKIIDGEKWFLHMIDDKLAIKKEKPNNLFSFEIIKDDPFNIYRNLSYKDNRKSKGVLWDSMNKFIKNNSDVKFEKKNISGWWIIDIVFIVSILILCIFSIIMSILLMKKRV
jgi:hypothetical protein